MRITFLMTSATERGLRSGHRLSWLATANALQDAGHDVTVVIPPDTGWESSGIEARCALHRSDLRNPAGRVPATDVIVATSWTMVAPALEANCAPVVHLCTDDAGLLAASDGLADAASARAAFTAAGVLQVADAPCLVEAMRREFGIEAQLVTRGVATTLLAPSEPNDAVTRPVRVGLIGDGAHPSDNLNIGLEACSLAQRAGLDVQIVRIAAGPTVTPNSEPGAAAEWHADVDGSRVRELLHSLDVYVGTAVGDADAALLDVLAAGIPCVLTDSPCHRQFGSAQFALFTEPGASAQLAEALVVAAHHAQLRDELRRNAAATASEHTIERHAAELATVLAEIAIDSRPAPPSPPTDPLSAHAQAQAQAQAVTTAALHQWLAATRTILETHGDLDPFESTASRLTDLLGAEIEHRRGLLRYAAGDAPGAVRCFSAALRNTTLPAEVRNDLGVAMFASGDPAGACAEFERALAIDPDHPDARVNLEQTASRRHATCAVATRG